MKYAVARPHIKSGDLLGWSRREPFWKSIHAFKVFCIRLFRLQPWTHSGTAWVVGERVFVIEAVKSAGVRIFPLSKCGPFGWLNLNAPWKPETLNLAMSVMGEPYSELEAMLASFEELKLSGVWECAKLAAFLARSDGIELGKVYTPDAIIEAALALDGVTLTMVEQ